VTINVHLQRTWHLAEVIAFLDHGRFSRDGTGQSLTAEGGPYADFLPLNERVHMSDSLPRVSAAVMSHESRYPDAVRLAAAIGDCCQVVTDPDPGAGPATLRTARVAWTAASDDATHHLLLQDDVVVAPGFMAAVRQAVADHPEAALAFFTEWGSRSADMLRIAAIIGSPWLECVDRYLPTQAVVLPAAVARGFGEHTATLDPRTPDDNALLAYLRCHRIPALIAVPNLADHLDMPSLVGNHWMGSRRSACYREDLAGTPAGHPGSRQASSIPRVLPAARLVPHLAWEDAAAVYWVVDDDVTADWDVCPLPSLLDRIGAGEAFRQEALEAATSHLVGGAAEVASPLAFEALADVAMALGLATLRWSDILLRDQQISVAGRRAMRTLALGGLRLHAAAELATVHGKAIEDFVVTAARTSARLSREYSLRVFDCWDANWTTAEFGR
jgi:hypothetical protein